MDEESALAPEAGPEAVVEAPKGEETEGQVETPPAEGEKPEEKSESAKRREREKAYRARLQAEHAEAMSKADEAEKRRVAVIEAGKKEAPPREADFPDPIEYAAAKAIWGAEQRVREREANGAGEAAAAAKRQAEEITVRERELIAQSWGAQMDDARGRYADFDAVALSPQVPITPEVGMLIATSDQGADVAYYLGQHRALAAQIAGLSQVEAARAIGRIEATLQAPKPRTETQAPSPISPVRGGASATAKDPAKMSYAEFKAFREAGGTIR
jgi:hypothetical protein